MSLYCIITERCGAHTMHFFNTIQDAKDFALSTPFWWAFHRAECLDGKPSPTGNALATSTWVYAEDAAFFDALLLENKKVAA